MRATTDRLLGAGLNVAVLVAVITLWPMKADYISALGTHFERAPPQWEGRIRNVESRVGRLEFIGRLCGPVWGGLDVYEDETGEVWWLVGCVGAPQSCPAGLPAKALADRMTHQIGLELSDAPSTSTKASRE